jgi:hypothetical protein
MVKHRGLQALVLVRPGLSEKSNFFMGRIETL